MYYVYVLYSDKLEKRYIGSTGDLPARIDQHNQGKTPFTKSSIPWRLVYYEAFVAKSDALTEEKFLKSGQGRERLKRVLENSLVGSAP